MKLIKPSNISGEIMTLFEEADERVVVVSPYCRIKKWYKLSNKLNELNERNIPIEFYVREGETTAIKELQTMNVQPIEIPKLHCKFYLNERYGIVTSMNLLLSSEISALEIGYTTSNSREYNELLGFYERYIRPFHEKKFEASDFVFDDYIQEKISTLLDKQASVWYEEDKLRIYTGRNNYESFIFRKRRANFIRINGILTYREFSFAKENNKSINEKILLDIELQEGKKGFYDLIWGTGTNPLQSRSIMEVLLAEKSKIADWIVNFVVEVDRLKINCSRKS